MSVYVMVNMRNCAFCKTFQQLAKCPAICKRFTLPPKCLFKCLNEPVLRYRFKILIAIVGSGRSRPSTKRPWSYILYIKTQ